MTFLSTLGIIALTIIAAALLIIAAGMFWDHFFGPPTIKASFVDWFDKNYDKLEVHDKSFPNFDLPSVRRAIDSYLEECCVRAKEVGATPSTHMRELFATLAEHSVRPMPFTFERVPVDIGEEASFPLNVLWLAETEDGDRIAILMAVGVIQGGYFDFDGSHSPQMQLSITVACRSKEVADGFYGEIDQRRRALSIYRGKVIDPVVDPGGIRTIRFRAIKEVAEDELVLSDHVRELLDSALVRFYEQSDKLEALGLDKKRGILLHGPPGTGKTSLCLSLAQKLERFTICFVSGDQLLYPRELCRMARYLQPTMIVFEDIDLIAEQRDSNGLATILGELMNQIDGCEAHEEVLFVMNTNSLVRLEAAVKNRPGRVDQIIELSVPDAEQRRRLIERFSEKVQLRVNDWKQVESATAGATPAMLKEIVKRAIVSALAEQQPDDVSTLFVDEGGLLLATEQVRLLRDRTGDPPAIGFAAGA